MTEIPGWAWRNLSLIAKGLGNHPGTIPMLAFLTMGGFAGAARGGYWWIIGISAMAVAFGPAYLYGAWERGRDEARRLAEEASNND